MLVTNPVPAGVHAVGFVKNARGDRFAPLGSSQGRFRPSMSVQSGSGPSSGKPLGSSQREADSGLKNAMQRWLSWL